MEEKNKYIYGASFDIGKKNFSFYIEKFNIEELNNIKNIPKTKRYNDDGTCTEEMEQILEQVYKNGETIFHINASIDQNCDISKKLDPETFHNMNDFLDKYLNLFDLCDIVIIEEQMSFGKKFNKMAYKLGQHCYSYFTFKYGRTKKIYEFPAYHKTQILGAPKIPGKPYKSGKTRWKAMEKPARKKWSVAKSKEIMELRNDKEGLEEFRKTKKKDDKADTQCQFQAAKYLIYVDKTL